MRRCNRLFTKLHAINDLAGKIPGIAHHYDDAHLDKEGHLHNALLDNLHVEGTPELTALKNKLEHDAAAAGQALSKSNIDLALQMNEMTKFDAKDESVMLLLLALQDKKYVVEDDWKDVYVNRAPLGGGMFAALNSGPSNKFTQLLAHVGLPKPPTSANDTVVVDESTKKFSILDDAHQVYILSRADWVKKVRHRLVSLYSARAIVPSRSELKPCSIRSTPPTQRMRSI